MILDERTLGLFTLACLALAALPGPDMMLFVSRSMVQGWRVGVAALCGAVLGCFCQAMAAGLGLSRLFLLVPVAFQAVRLLGAAYLLYLAWSTLRARPAALSAAGVPPLPFATALRQGLFTNLLNPKVALFMLALLPQFLHPERGHMAAQVLLLSLIQMSTGVLVNLPIILAAAHLARWLGARAPSRWRRLPGLLLGGLFAGLALDLLHGDLR